MLCIQGIGHVLCSVCCDQIVGGYNPITGQCYDSSMVRFALTLYTGCCWVSLLLSDYVLSLCHTDTYPTYVYYVLALFLVMCFWVYLVDLRFNKHSEFSRSFITTVAQSSSAQKQCCRHGQKGCCPEQENWAKLTNPAQRLQNEMWSISVIVTAHRSSSFLEVCCSQYDDAMMM